MTNTEDTTTEVLSYIDHDVAPQVLLGWLHAVLDAGGVVDAAEWNKAIQTLAPKGTK